MGQIKKTNCWNAFGSENNKPVKCLPVWYVCKSSFPLITKHYVVFDVFADFQSLFQPENLGSHKSHLSTDDRFLPQGQQILPKIHQVRPMPTTLVFFLTFYLPIITRELPGFHL